MMVVLLSAWIWRTTDERMLAAVTASLAPADILMMWLSSIVDCCVYVYSRHDVRGSLLQVGSETAAGTAARFGVRQLT